MIYESLYLFPVSHVAMAQGSGPSKRELIFQVPSHRCLLLVGGRLSQTRPKAVRLWSLSWKNLLGVDTETKWAIAIFVFTCVRVFGRGPGQHGRLPFGCFCLTRYPSR